MICNGREQGGGGGGEGWVCTNAVSLAKSVNGSCIFHRAYHPLSADPAVGIVAWQGERERECFSAVCPLTGIPPPANTGHPCWGSGVDPVAGVHHDHQVQGALPPDHSHGSVDAVSIHPQQSCAFWICICYMQFSRNYQLMVMESWELWGVEEAGCKIYSGAPTVSQTTG